MCSHDHSVIKLSDHTVRFYMALVSPPSFMSYNPVGTMGLQCGPEAGDHKPGLYRDDSGNHWCKARCLTWQPVRRVGAGELWKVGQVSGAGLGRDPGTPHTVPRLGHSLRPGNVPCRPKDSSRHPPQEICVSQLPLIPSRRGGLTANYQSARWAVPHRGRDGG